MTRNRWLAALIFVVTAGSFLLEMWPVATVGVIAMGFVGRGFLAPLLGLLLDFAYGAPLGTASYLFFPFALLGFIVVALRYSTRRFFLDRASPDKL